MGCASAEGLSQRQRTVSPVANVNRSVYGHDLPLITIMSRGIHGLGWVVSASSNHVPMTKTRSAGATSVESTISAPYSWLSSP